MSATTNPRKLTADYASFAEDEFNAGRLTRAKLNEVLLQVAAEYLTEHQDEEACLATIYKVDPEFIQTRLKMAMEDDSFLARSMAELVYHLERRGMTAEMVIRPTQPGVGLA